MNRKPTVVFIITLLCVTLAGSVAAQSDKPEAVDAAVSASFTYQGQLRQGGAAVSGSCDMAFRLYDNPSGGNSIGSPITTTTTINSGLFTVALNFGSNAFQGAARWLDIRLRCPAGSGSYTTLTPRQQITAAPYALAPWVTSGNNLYYSAGSVGIGTSSPQRSVHVSGANSGLRLESSNSQIWTTTEYQTDARLWHTGVGGSAVSNDVKSKYYIFDGTAGQFRMVIDTIGNVGIGTTNPIAALDVNGGIRGTSLTAPSLTAPTNLFLNATGRIALRTSPGGQYAERMTILDNGNVGIGITSPAAKLHVRGIDTLATTYALRVDRGDGAWGLLVDNSARTHVYLPYDETTSHVCQVVGAQHLSHCSSAAEYVPTIDGGYGYPQTADLVSIAPAVSNPYGDTHSPFAVEKAATPCDPNLLGFIVKPETGADGKKLNDHYLPLAIYGYFPAKVSVENGAIKRGDALTSSSKPGYAMKATQACKTIGYALEDANAEGTIQVFAHLSENSAPEVASLRARVKGLEEQNAALDARLTALEQTMSAQAPTQSAAPREVVLFGALLVVGIVVGRRMDTRGS
jgi:hypothetical protein